MVQMHVTVPHHQQGPALSCFAALSISLPLATDPSLRGGVTGCDCSNYQGQFVQIEPCLNDQSRYCHPERSEGSLCPSRETLRSAQGDKTFPILVVKPHYRPLPAVPLSRLQS